MYPGKYNSDFAIQVTSQISDAQQHTINFTNNNLMGSANFLEYYKTSKARACVTVGMMTTGYDCPDLLNLCLMRPIFSPTDFIQIKGRGTRKHNFTEQLFDDDHKSILNNPEKKQFKLFDFFANCEYFEEHFDYDEVIKLPKPSQPHESPDGTKPLSTGEYENFDPDPILTVDTKAIGIEGMKIDRMFFDKFEEKVKEDSTIKDHLKQNNWDGVIEYVNNNIMNQPNEYFTLEKLRKAAGVDRRIGLREIIEKAFGKIDRFKSKNELLNEEFDKFMNDLKPQDVAAIISMKYFFKAYITDSHVRDIVENKNFTDLNTNPTFTMKDFKAVPKSWRISIPEYIKDYVPLNQFMV